MCEARAGKVGVDVPAVPVELPPVMATTDARVSKDPASPPAAYKWVELPSVY